MSSGGKRRRETVDAPFGSNGNPPEAAPPATAFSNGLGAPQSPSSAALAQACALLGAADGEAPSAFLPVGAAWQVLPLVTPDGLRLHAVAPEAVLDVSVAGEALCSCVGLLEDLEPVVELPPAPCAPSLLQEGRRHPAASAGPGRSRPSAPSGLEN